MQSPVSHSCCRDLLPKSRDESGRRKSFGGQDALPHGPHRRTPVADQGEPRDAVVEARRVELELEVAKRTRELSEEKNLVEDQHERIELLLNQALEIDPGCVEALHLSGKATCRSQLLAHS